MKIIEVVAQYPAFDNMEKNKSTPFLHNYNREWVKMGHEVTVIHVCTRYLPIFNTAVKVLKGLHLSVYKKLEPYVYPKGLMTENSYTANGITVHRFTTLKLIPHGMAMSGEIRKAQKKVSELANTLGEPDVVIFDFANPSLLFEKYFDGAKKLFVMHSTDEHYMTDEKYRKLFLPVLEKFDYIAFRCNAIRDTFEKNCFVPRKCGIIDSGVPADAIPESPVFRTKIKKLVYVGRLIKRKHIDTIMDAMSRAGDRELELNILGDGPEEQDLRDYAEKVGVGARCHFIGKVPRSKVFEYVNAADCFIMLSEGETFGMVYVEAMAKGAVTVGSAGEGIDGVLKDGENGYLLPAGDADALTALLDRLACNGGSEEIRRISENGYKTVLGMTDEKLALKVEDILKNL